MYFSHDKKEINEKWNYSWPLNNAGVGTPTPHTPCNQRLVYKFCPSPPKTLTSHLLVFARHSKISDAQVPHIKGYRTMHTVGPLHPQIPSLWFIESMDAKSEDTEGWLWIYWKTKQNKPAYIEVDHAVQTHVMILCTIKRKLRISVVFLIFF